MLEQFVESGLVWGVFFKQLYAASTCHWSYWVLGHCMPYGE